MFRSFAAALVAISALMHTCAWASYPGLSVSFVDPVGEVRAGESFEIWVRLSLAPGAQPLNFDGTAGGSGFNLPPNLLPVTGRMPGDDSAPTELFGQLDSAITSLTIECVNENNLLDACHEFLGSFSSAPLSPPGYRFKFAYPDGSPDTILSASALNSQPFLQLAGGQSVDLLLGVATPEAALVGQSYAIGALQTSLYFRGLSQIGASTGPQTALTASIELTPKSSHGFSRTVVAGVVPEPDTWAMLALGLGAAAWRARRNRAKA